MDNTSLFPLLEKYKRNSSEKLATKIKKSIDSGEFNLSEIKDDKTPLMYCCCYNSSFSDFIHISMKLIQTGKAYPEFVDNEGKTALIYLCNNGSTVRHDNLAIQIIETGKSLPEQVDKDGNTALILACKNNINHTRFKLIETGMSKPEQVNTDGNTALIYACKVGFLSTDIALKLIETGNSRPEQINKENLSALSYACKNKLSEVALKIIEVIKENPSIPIYIYENAYSIALENNMFEVIDILNSLINNKETIDDKLFININEIGFDILNQEHLKIKEYLNNNTNGICIKVNNQYFLIDNRNIINQMSNNYNIKYGCKTAGNTSQYILDSNIIYNTEYFSISSIFGFQILVDYKKFADQLSSSNKLFTLIPTSLTFPSIISKEFINGRSGISADHCQPGKETIVYDSHISYPIQKEKEKEIQEKEIQEKEKIKVQYKTSIYSFPITLTTTLNDIKQDLLKMTSNIDNNIKVKFIYKGKIYTNMDTELSSIESNPNGITLQSIISPVTGGKKMKKQKTKKRNQFKKKTNRYVRNSKTSKFRK